MIRNILFSLLLFSAIASASVNNTPPLKIDRVIDRANLLTAQQFKTLNNLLINFENNRNDGSQFVVYIVPTTGSENIETFANRVFNQWGIGKKGLDNGLLLVVAINDRSVRFEVGYGYEGTFTDVLAGRIIRKNMLPYFRAENYYTGIEQGIINAIHVANDRPISSTNSLTDLIPLKILQTHFILIYVIILGLIYCFQLVFSTKKLKRKINQVIAQSGKKKKNSEKRGYKIGANQLKRLKNYLNYSFYFPTSFSLYFPVVFCSVVVIFYTQIILSGIVNPFILLLMVVLSLFFNLISLT
ncbi:TPM domain-containing protein, partial [Providencia sp. PROV175]